MSDTIKVSILSIFLTVLTIFGAYKVWWGGKFVPEEFVDSRIKGAVIAEKIVNLSNSSIKSIEKIAEHEANGSYKLAVSIVSQELDKTKEIRQEAIKLSNYLDQMAKSLSSIKPRKARDLATEAVGQEVQLINRLLSYSEYLNYLFELLRAKFEGKINDGEARLQELLQLTNQEVNSINTLNQKFNLTMEKFDALTLVQD